MRYTWVNIGKFIKIRIFQRQYLGYHISDWNECWANEKFFLGAIRWRRVLFCDFHIWIFHFLTSEQNFQKTKTRCQEEPLYNHNMLWNYHHDPLHSYFLAIFKIRFKKWFFFSFFTRDCKAVIPYKAIIFSECIVPIIVLPLSKFNWIRANGFWDILA